MSICCYAELHSKVTSSQRIFLSTLSKESHICPTSSAFLLSFFFSFFFLGVPYFGNKKFNVCILPLGRSPIEAGRFLTYCYDLQTYGFFLAKRLKNSYKNKLIICYHRILKRILYIFILISGLIYIDIIFGLQLHNVCSKR